MIRILFFVFLVVIFLGCKTSGPGLFSKKTPREVYADNIEDAGLRNSEMGLRWFNASSSALSKPLNITVPYREFGYFAASDPRAVGLKFLAKRGQQIKVAVTRKPAAGGHLYVELWEDGSTSDSRSIAHIDSTTSSFDFEVDADGSYILTIQPELLKSIEYTIDIIVGPTLAFPVSAKNANIGSIWGDDRDGGARRHEGIDIFAAKGSPVIASADGRIRANENELGGKVLWLRPENKDYTIYYAHLDQQLVSTGDKVWIGDTIGLVGNTGNARTTPPHLHLGIYASGGAIDPFPFVNPDVKQPQNIVASIPFPDVLRRTTGDAKIYLSPDIKSSSIPVKRNSMLRLESASAGWYRVMLPDNTLGYIDHRSTTSIDNIVRTISLKVETVLFDSPFSAALRKTILPSGTKAAVHAMFGDFSYVRVGDVDGWIYASN